MRTVGVKVLADSAQYERAMLESGASTEKLAKSMDKAAGEARDLTRATNEARTAALEQAAAERAAATATERSAAAAKKASKAQVAAGAAAEDAAEAAQKLARGEISAEEAQKLAAKAARKDRDAQIANAAAQRAAAIETEKLERAAIKASAAQLAQAKAARAAGAVAGSRGLTHRQGASLLSSLVGDGTIVGKDAAKAFVEGFQSTARTGSKSLMADLEGAVASAGEVLWPALVGAAVGATPFVVSAIGAAVLGGVGAVGIGAAIAGQIDSADVQASWTHLAEFAKDALTRATSSMEEPLAHAADIFGHQLDLSTGDFQKFIDELSPTIDHLAQGLASAFGNIVTYLPEIGDDIAPIIDLVANLLPRAGLQVGEFLQMISANSEGAAESIGLLFKLFGAGLQVVGETIAGAEFAVQSFFRQIYTVIKLASKVPSAYQDELKALARNMENTFDTSGKAANGVDGFGASARGAATQAQALNDQLTTLNDTISSQLNASLNAEQAALRYKDALAGLTGAVQQNGTSLDANTSSGRKNREQLIGIIQQAEHAREAYIEQHKATDGLAKATADANAKFGDNIASLEKQAEDAGFSKDQVRGLLVQLGLLPDKKSSKVQVPGASESARLVQILQQRLNGLKDKYITVWTTYKDTSGNTIHHVEGMNGGGRQQADGGILDFRRYAAGGVYEPSHIASIVPAGTYRLMAEPETGGEAYIPLARSKRTRSISVLEEAARRLDVPVGQVVMASAPSVTLRPQFDVQVLVGNQNITDMVDVRITEHDRQIERGVGAGRRR